VDTLDFWFDYSSPYGYLASERIEAIAQRHRRRVVFRPILLGAVFKVTGGAPLTEAPMKGDYALQDFARSAREHDIAFTQPETFPIASVAAARATLWLRDNADATLSARAPELVHALYRAFYVDNVDIGQPTAVLDTIAALGLSRDAAAQALGDAAIKQALKAEVDAGIAAGVFGSPMTIIDGQRFWGHDRLEQVDRWLERGGW